MVSYTGHDIVENQSGSHVGHTRISKKGNSRIRRALFMPAFSVVAHKQAPFIHLYKRVFKRTKIKMKAYVAVQRKLLVIIYALWKKNEKYAPDYYQNKHPKEKERVPASLPAWNKPIMTTKVASPKMEMLHEVNILSKNCSLPPLCIPKIKEICLVF